MNDNQVIDAMLGSPRAFTVAAAGCGKTELLGKIIAHPRSGRQLVLTHTHAGVGALKKRLIERRVPIEKYQLDTIAGWCLRYASAYPEISGLRSNVQMLPDWSAAYSGAERICNTSLGRRIISQSYDGVLIDEYQDCSVQQHAVVLSIGNSIPYRGFGDPLQTVFGFNNDRCVTWPTIQEDFEVMESMLCCPWRWYRQGRNRELGQWLIEARRQLEETGRLEISNSAPVTWLPHDSSVWAKVCRSIAARKETAVAILKWPRECKLLAQRLGGFWAIVERFDAQT